MIKKCAICGEVKELVNLDGMCEKYNKELIEDLEQMRKDELEEIYYDKFY